MSHDVTLCHVPQLIMSPCPGGLPSDPRTWGRDEVTQFLQYCEKEFDLERIDMDRFQMNGEWSFMIQTNFLEV